MWRGRAGGGKEWGVLTFILLFLVKVRHGRVARSLVEHRFTASAFAASDTIPPYSLPTYTLFYLPRDEVDAWWSNESIYRYTDYSRSSSSSS